MSIGQAVVYGYLAAFTVIAFLVGAIIIRAGDGSMTGRAELEETIREDTNAGALPGEAVIP